MTRRSRAGLAGLLTCAALASDAAAQPLGTFRWQLQPFCNVVTMAVTQSGAVYRLEGTDDQCGNAADAASVTGTAFPNADGTIGFGLNIVTTPGGRPLHVDAEITLAAFSGTWRDSAGATGTFAFTPGAGTGGRARPLPSSVPSTITLRSDGSFVARGSLDQGTVPETGFGVRAMWYAGKAAFRAGQVSGAEWDEANVGQYSMALGLNPRASGFGGVALGNHTIADGAFATAVGSGTRASGQASTALGLNTLASGPVSTAVGQGTSALGLNAFAGGSGSRAEGTNTFALGDVTRALGTASVALGTRAVADGGSFVFADASSLTAFGSGSNQFFVRASSGVAFFTNPASTSGVRLAAGGSQWLTVSDVHAKQRFRELDGDDILARLARLPVTEWSYKAQGDAIRHIGPTAQDFHAAFGLGEDPLRIGTLDADGVALAAVKALEARSRRQSDEMDQLKAEVTRLRELLAALAGQPWR
jgi:hypothetical protein